MKINNKFEKSLRGFKKVKLDEITKNRIKSEIFRYNTSKYSKNILTPSTYFNVFHFSYKRIGLVFLMLFFISIGTTNASMFSLPGDLLYPIKTNITEPLIKLTKTTPEAKAKFNLLLIDTRILELEKLIVKSHPNEENVKENFILFEKSIQESKKNIAKEKQANTETKILKETELLTTILEKEIKKDENMSDKLKVEINAKENTKIENEKELELNSKIEKYNELIISVPELNDFYENTVKTHLPTTKKEIKEEIEKPETDLIIEEKVNKDNEIKTDSTPKNKEMPTSTGSINTSLP